MYPVVAAIINYFILDEPLSLRQLVGMSLAVVAIAIFATGFTRRSPLRIPLRLTAVASAR